MPQHKLVSFAVITATATQFSPRTQQSSTSHEYVTIPEEEKRITTIEMILSVAVKEGHPVIIIGTHILPLSR